VVTATGGGLEEDSNDEAVFVVEAMFEGFAKAGAESPSETVLAEVVDAAREAIAAGMSFAKVGEVLWPIPEGGIVRTNGLARNRAGQLMAKAAALVKVAEASTVRAKSLERQPTGEPWPTNVEGVE
jgi:hypothetical protein